MSVLPVEQQPGMTERLTLTAGGPAGLSGVEPASGEQGSFLDFLDVINPLQHIPIVNTIYRELTGDTIKPVPALVGGTLFGGPIGFAAAMANMAVEDQTGKTMDQHLVSLFKDEPEPTAVADAMPVAAPPPPPPAADEPPLPEPAPRPQVIAFNGTTPQDETALSGQALFTAAQELAAAPTAAPTNNASATPATVPPAPVSAPAAQIAAATPTIAAPSGPPAGDPRFMPMPTREARMMPLPQRPGAPVPVAPPPQVAAAPDAAAIRRAMAAQGLSDATAHPLLQASEEGGQDWFSNGMIANLERYQAAGAPR